MPAGQFELAHVRLACKLQAKTVRAFVGAVHADDGHFCFGDFRKHGNRAFVLGRAEPVADVDLEYRLGIGRDQHLCGEALARGVWVPGLLIDIAALVSGGYRRFLIG